MRPERTASLRPADSSSVLRSSERHVSSSQLYQGISDLLLEQGDKPATVLDDPELFVDVEGVETANEVWVAQRLEVIYKKRQGEPGGDDKGAPRAPSTLAVFCGLRVTSKAIVLTTTSFSKASHRAWRMVKEKRLGHCEAKDLPHAIADLLAKLVAFGLARQQNVATSAVRTRQRAPRRRRHCLRCRRGCGHGQRGRREA